MSVRFLIVGTAANGVNMGKRKTRVEKIDTEGEVDAVSAAEEADESVENSTSDSEEVLPSVED